jgi:hypothetical protein
MKISKISSIEATNRFNGYHINKILFDNQFILVEFDDKILIFKDGELEFDEFFNIKDQVFMVLKNADFTEGRGPMLPHKCFKSLKDSVDYIMKQPGIYGGEQSLNIMCNVNIYGEVYAYNNFNGYDIKVMKVE